MSFQSLKVDELKKVAEFFVVDVEAADPEHGPTKKELLAALAAGDNPVTWDDYKNTYLESDVKKAEDARAEAEEEARADVSDETDESDDDSSDESDPVAEEKEEENILVKFERKNPTWQTLGYTFTKDHPYKSVPVSIAEELVRRGDVRLALPSEVKDYYS